MLKLIFIYFISLTSWELFSQKLWIGLSTPTGRNDSVLIGFDNNATIGIDSTLGEKAVNFLNDSLNLLFVAQRDSLNHNCLNSGFPDYQPINFTNHNFDSEINYRNLNAKNVSYFEIVMNETNPTNAIIRLKCDYKLDSLIEYVEMDNQKCSIMKSRWNSFNGNKDYLFFLTYKVYNMIIKFRNINTSNTEVLKEQESYYKVIDNVIYFDNNYHCKKILVSSIDGKLIYESDNSDPIRISHINKGFYVIMILLSSGQRISKSFVKF